MAQIEATTALLEKQGLDVVMAAVSELKPDADGKLQGWQICSDTNLKIADFKAALADPAAGEAGDFARMADHLTGVADHAVIIDTTASEFVSNMYDMWLGKGVHVVTPNKKVGSGDLKRWKACTAAMESTGAKWGDETTVGAGLPILNILRTDLINTGDEIKSIEGIFSGTLSYLFNEYKAGMKFSDVIKDAKGKGFTEPDPRDDLSGTDVARKVTILARQCGIEIELDDVPVASLVPDALADWAPKEGEVMADAFIKEMEAFDDEMEAKYVEAEAAGNCLRFVGVVDVPGHDRLVHAHRVPPCRHRRRLRRARPTRSSSTPSSTPRSQARATRRKAATERRLRCERRGGGGRGEGPSALTRPAQARTSKIGRASCRERV